MKQAINIVFHRICQSCLEARWSQEDDVPQIHLGDAGTCCWCQAIGPVADYTSYLSPAACAGHRDDDIWQLADYARAVVGAYRVVDRTERRNAVADAIEALERRNAVADAIEALEEELWRQPDPKL